MGRKIYCSKYYLKRELVYLLHKMLRIKTNFELFKDLKTGEVKEYITDNIPKCSYWILTALSNNVFLELSKIIVDTPEFQGKENICLKNLIKLYKNDCSLFKLKKYYYIKGMNNKRKRIYISVQSINNIIQNLEDKTDKNNKIFDFLKQLRHKDLAHNDKEFGFKSKRKFSKKSISYKELEDFINELYNDLNELYKSLFSTTMIYTNDYKDELSWLKEIMKKEIETNYPWYEKYKK